MDNQYQETSGLVSTKWLLRLPMHFLWENGLEAEGS